ncbi:lipopolysaccharide assembly protein LapB [Pelistega europaea]|uniref:Lipopolysaccharide assembly protein B n=1 Tax=Pelistega europaea TaxID=106147 RepID=A0A7Y4L9Q4_9BURK|nr:lipopolysaccharide assembly protein LapB [Pelistega europaea]NOL49547.1 lipopolysaccharide assembly protein LapB [Pelistega europaea]
MDLEESWWLILFPIVFGLGWLASRYDLRQMMSESRSLPNSYFKGLNFLLNEDHDKAIDAFVEVAKLDTETTELHFALGSLFRRRGEIERAIRVHQSLLNRADLPPKDQEQARFELAQDYLKAGMFDRAEEAFHQTLQGTYALASTRALIRIYEATHDWTRAIETVKHLQGLLSEPVPQVVHYYCERVDAFLSTKPPQLAKAQQELEHAEYALTQLPDVPKQTAVHARIAMLRAKMATLEGDALSTRHHLESIFQQAPEYVGLIAQPLLENYIQSHEGEQGIQLLRQHYRQYPSLDLFNVIFKYLRTQVGAASAWDFARESLVVSPSLLGLDKLLEVELKAEAGEHNKTPEKPQVLPEIDLDLLHKMIHKHTQRLDRYACQHCGFQARAFYWQCPGCNYWDTYAPKRLEEQ